MCVCRSLLPSFSPTYTQVSDGDPLSSTMTMTTTMMMAFCPMVRLFFPPSSSVLVCNSPWHNAACLQGVSGLSTRHPAGVGWAMKLIRSSWYVAHPHSNVLLASCVGRKGWERGPQSACDDLRLLANPSYKSPNNFPEASLINILDVISFPSSFSLFRGVCSPCSFSLTPLP